MNRTLWAVIVAFISGQATAMPIKSETLKKQVSVVDADNRPVQTLDLKAKTLKLGRQDLDVCGESMVRKAQTLTFSCTIPIPLTAKFSRFQNLNSAKSVSSVFAGAKRDVQIDVANDGRTLNLTTSFDATGIDFEISKFNDDFFAVYAQAAHSVISDALKNQLIRMEVVESR